MFSQTVIEKKIGRLYDKNIITITKIIRRGNIKMKKLISVLLLTAMLLTLFTSCADNADKDGEKDAENTGNSSDTAQKEDETSDNKTETLDIPNEKFTDIDFTILVNENYSWNYAAADFDEPSDDPLANALYERNLAVEELLGCTISQSVSTTYDSIATDFSTSVDAGDDTAFDVAALNLLHCGTNVGAGRCYDLSTFQYLDLSKSWWDQASVEQLAIGGKNYMVGGEALYSDKELLWLIFFTKKLVTDNGLEDPYKLVANNEWTWDKMEEMISVVAVDENYNGVWDDPDIFGLCTHDYHYAAMWVSAGQRLVRLDDDGVPYQTWGEESFFDAYEKIVEMTTMDGVKDDSDSFIITKMKEGKTLFAGEVVGWVSGYRDNDYDFGLLPVPKYSKDQDSYYTLVCQQADLLVVGNNQTDTYSTGIILEALAAKGKEILLPAYYEKQLQSRYARDEESSAMLDIIFNNRVYDIGTMFNWANISTQLMVHGGGNPSSLYASNEKAFRKAMEKSFEKILG